MYRILIIGQGNIGTFFGASFSETENEVIHFIRNTGTYRASVGLQFNDRRQVLNKIKKGTVYKYNSITNPLLIKTFDFIIVSVAHHRWRNVLDNIIPFLTDKQILILSGNVWNDFAWFETNIRSPYVFAFPNFGGAIIENDLEGWLTKNITMGVINPDYRNSLQKVFSLLTDTGFEPVIESDIRGWLMTHFAYSAGMLAEAARQNGYQYMTKKWSSLLNSYKLMRECISVVKSYGIDTSEFKEARSVQMPIWINAAKTYSMFLLPGLSKSIDAVKNIPDWLSYSEFVYRSAKELGINTPMLSEYEKLWNEKPLVSIHN